MFPFEFTQPDLYATDTFTPAKIDEIVNGFLGDYVGFAAHMDGVRAQGMHNAAHLMTRPGYAHLDQGQYYFFIND